MAQVCGPAEDRASPEEIVALPTITSTESDESAPLRVLAFDTQNTFARLFSRSLSNHLTCKPGCINHPYAIAATLGPERIHLQVGKEQTRELWMERVNSAPERIASMTYERATNKLLRDADKLEQKVCLLGPLNLEDIVLINSHLHREERYLLQNTLPSQ
jgi:hypothetical protein